MEVLNAILSFGMALLYAVESYFYPDTVDTIEVLHRKSFSYSYFNLFWFGSSLDIFC